MPNPAEIIRAGAELLGELSPGMAEQARAGAERLAQEILSSEKVVTSGSRLVGEDSLELTAAKRSTQGLAAPVRELREFRPAALVHVEPQP